MNKSKRAVRKIRDIPAPQFNHERKRYEARPIARLGSQIPFGYEQDPDDPDILNPIMDELILLEKAKNYIRKGYPIPRVTDWLVYHSGKKISWQGLQKRYRTDVKREKALRDSKVILNELIRVYNKALRIEMRQLHLRNPRAESIKQSLLKSIDEHITE